MAVDTPGASPGSNLTMQKWQGSLEAAIYDRQWFLPRITDKERGYGQLNVRKMGTFTGATAASSEDGVTAFASFQSGSPTSVAMTPSWLLVPTALPDSVGFVAGDNIDDAYASGVEDALAAYIESQALSDVPSLTNFLGNAAYDMDVAGARAAVANLRNTAKVLADPVNKQIFGLFGALQHDDVMSIPEFTHAEQRGDGKSPLVSGVVGKGNAVTIEFTTLLTSDANGLHGVIWVPSAFAYWYNKRPAVEKQRYLKQNRILADCHFSHAIIHNARAIGMRTRTS